MCLLLVRSAGRIAAPIAYTFGGDADRDLALIEITAHPERRGQGSGTAILRAVIPVIRATGRTRIGATVRSGDPESTWVLSCGVL